MPDTLKHAIITPLLKKLNLELIKKNYRPVSNLPFLSKLIERAVASQLIDHLSENELNDIFQSAYRKFHSTETALLRVQNDILMNMDKKKAVMLVLLDMSAAFDTIDHKILLKRLSERCGIKGTALKWFTSYLTNRSQSVVIGSSHSKRKSLKYGVPQGSVLGPILFTIYTLPLGDIMKENDTDYQIYADDNELYMAFTPGDTDSESETKEKMETCIKHSGKFMLKNKMKRNDDKTEFMIIGLPQQLKKVTFDTLQIGSATVTATEKAKNLGIIFDREMNLKLHTNNICKSGFYHVKNLASIRNSLDEGSASIAAHAFITSKLDYGNSLLYGLPNTQIHKLQLVQNATARVVAKLRKYDRITAVRKKLHWLPIRARIEFKILLLTWKSRHKMAPKYLSDLLVENACTRDLRTDIQHKYIIPTTKNVTCGDRAFEKAAPTLWNALPPRLQIIDKLECFKRNLKTHLFTKYYPNTAS
jgi:hypothetical protein